MARANDRTSPSGNSSGRTAAVGRVAVAVAAALLVCPAPVTASAGPLQAIWEFFETQLGFPGLLGDELPARRDATAFVQKSRADVERGGLASLRAAELPAVKFVPAAELDEAWTALKKKSNYAWQLDTIDEMGLLTVAADDLQSIAELDAAFSDVYRRRDRYRERVYASPELVALLSRASVRAREELPGVRFTIGDVAQAGGGQIRFGVRVAPLQDGVLRQPLSALLADADWRDGTWSRRRTVEPRQEFDRDVWRFVDFDDRVLVDDTVRATIRGPEAPPRLSAFVETRRYYDNGSRTHDEMRDWWAGFSRRWRKATIVEDSATAWGADTVRVARLIKGRELVEVWLRDGGKPGVVKKRGRIEWPSFGRILEVQTSLLDHKKPGVRIRPSLWTPRADLAGGPGWQHWRLLYEATHISHMGGLDADISYAMDDVSYHFSKEIEHIDAGQSVAWIGILARSAEDVGVRIDKILVDPRVIRRLEESMPDDEPKPDFWALVAPAKGHDSHLHLRLQPGFQNVSGPADHLAPASTGRAVPTGN